MKLFISLFKDRETEPRPSIEVEDVWMHEPRLENREEEYFIPIENRVVCMRCQEPLRQVWAASDERAGLHCKCSAWECRASAMSGRAQYRDLRRTHVWTPEENAKTILHGLREDVKDALRKTLGTTA